MMEEIFENIRVLGPVFAFLWALTLFCVLLWPQRFFNSILLMLSLLVTMLFVSGFFGSGGRGIFLLVCFLAVMLALLLTPVLLVLNGVQMLRRESLSPAHILSLALGIFVGAGEIAAGVYVLGLGEYLSLAEANFFVMLLALTVFYFSLLVLCFVLYSLFIQFVPRRMAFNYVIIHGCGLAEGERLTRLLQNRVDKAVEVYRRCRRKPVIIPSGGRGEDEKLSEAQAMKDYLLAQGIPEAHIVLEDRSATTRENLLNSKAIIEAGRGGKRTALVSSNYHVYRCLRLARDCGLRCTGIGARVALYYWPSALIREFLAVFLTRRFLLWALLGYLLFIGPLLYVFLS